MIDSNGSKLYHKKSPMAYLVSRNIQSAVGSQKAREDEASARATWA
jgi:hypothetical protein